jgi:hypothetical protein
MVRCALSRRRVHAVHSAVANPLILSRAEYVTYEVERLPDQLYGRDMTNSLGGGGGAGWDEEDARGSLLARLMRPPSGGEVGRLQRVDSPAAAALPSPVPLPAVLPPRLPPPRSVPLALAAPRLPPPSRPRMAAPPPVEDDLMSDLAGLVRDAAARRRGGGGGGRALPPPARPPPVRAGAGVRVDLVALLMGGGGKGRGAGGEDIEGEAGGAADPLLSFLPLPPSPPRRPPGPQYASPGHGLGGQGGRGRSSKASRRRGLLLHESFEREKEYLRSHGGGVAHTLAVGSGMEYAARAEARLVVEEVVEVRGGQALSSPLLVLRARVSGLVGGGLPVGSPLLLVLPTGQWTALKAECGKGGLQPLGAGEYGWAVGLLLRAHGSHTLWGVQWASGPPLVPVAEGEGGLPLCAFPLVTLHVN